MWHKVLDKLSTKISFGQVSGFHVLSFRITPRIPITSSDIARSYSLEILFFNPNWCLRVSENVVFCCVP